MARVVSYYLNTETEGAIRLRAVARSASRVVNAIVERYATICAAERPRLSEAEWAVVEAAIADGYVAERPSDRLGSISADIDAWLRDHPDAPVDGPTLVSKLRALSPAQSIALIDATETGR